MIFVGKSYRKSAGGFSSHVGLAGIHCEVRCNAELEEGKASPGEGEPWRKARAGAPVKLN